MIEIIPYERDKDAKTMYKFLHWFVRKYKREIDSDAKKAIKELYLHGVGTEKVDGWSKRSPNES